MVYLTNPMPTYQCFRKDNNSYPPINTKANSVQSSSKVVRYFIQVSVFPDKAFDFQNYIHDIICQRYSPHSHSIPLCDDSCSREDCAPLTFISDAEILTQDALEERSEYGQHGNQITGHFVLSTKHRPFLGGQKSKSNMIGCNGCRGNTFRCNGMTRHQRRHAETHGACPEVLRFS